MHWEVLPGVVGLRWCARRCNSQEASGAAVARHARVCTRATVGTRARGAGARPPVAARAGGPSRWQPDRRVHQACALARSSLTSHWHYLYGQVHQQLCRIIVAVALLERSSAAGQQQPIDRRKPGRPEAGDSGREREACPRPVGRAARGGQSARGRSAPGLPARHAPGARAAGRAARACTAAG